MSVLSVAMALLSFAAVTVLAVGLARRVMLYLATPVPLRIPTMPAPLTRAGAAARVGREVLLFQSLFGADKVLWLTSMLFHVGLLLVVLRHLRYFLPAPPLLVVLVQPLGIIGAFAMMIGLAALLARRVLLPRVRHVTRPTDLAMLVLLLAIGASGLIMTFVAHTDIMTLKQFLAGLPLLEVRAFPQDPALVIHLMLVAALMIVLPFSKLLHIPGIFFSPTRNQADDSRDRRHVADWARPLDQERP